MSEKIDIIDIKGEKKGEYTVKNASLEFEKGEQAVHDTVVAILAGERAGTASTKRRSEVRGGGAKPHRQKGLGRARAGSIRSPLWIGGGVTFGPKPRSYARKVNKKVRDLALKRAFSERVREGAVCVLDKLELADHRTKNVAGLLKAAGAADIPVLLLVAEIDENLCRATANIPNLTLVKAGCANVYQLLRFDKLLFTEKAIDALVKRFD